MAQYSDQNAAAAASSQHQQQQQQGGPVIYTNGPPPASPIPLPPPGIYTTNFAHGTNECGCAACELAQRYAVVYQKQFPAMTPAGTEMSRIDKAHHQNRSNHPCQMWSAYGFCFHGQTCMFPHVGSPVGAPAAPKDASPDQQALLPKEQFNAMSQQPVLFKKQSHAPFVSPKITAAMTTEELSVEIRTMCNEHANDVFMCRVCGYDAAFDGSCIIKVGEMFSYMTCPRCTSPLYQPLMLHIVEATLRETGGQDHIAFKDRIDALRNELPHMVRIPLSFEAHRLASTYFAWSLVGPKEAEEALTAAITETPLSDATTLISMGSGTGYVEHVFAEALRNMVARPEGQCPLKTPEQRKAFSILAFDEILRDSRFSVPVQYGTPDVINCLPDVTKTVLLLCWPPFGTPGGPDATMGFDILSRYMELGGRSVIYIGDVASTGDYEFHCALQRVYRPVPSYRTRHDLRRWVPQEMGLVFAGNDTIGVYKRRDPGDNFVYFAH